MYSGTSFAQSVHVGTNRLFVIKCTYWIKTKEVITIIIITNSYHIDRCSATVGITVILYYIHVRWWAFLFRLSNVPWPIGDSATRPLTDRTLRDVCNLFTNHRRDLENIDILIGSADRSCTRSAPTNVFVDVAPLDGPRIRQRYYKTYRVNRKTRFIVIDHDLCRGTSTMFSCYLWITPARSEVTAMTVITTVCRRNL